MLTARLGIDAPELSSCELSGLLIVVRRERELLSTPVLSREIASGNRSLVAMYLDALLARHAGLDVGEVAAYIPELARVDPSLFGICLATVDGGVYEAGDSRFPFTIQSMSKPLTYGIALERQIGRAHV